MATLMFFPVGMEKIALLIKKDYAWPLQEIAQTTNTLKGFNTIQAEVFWNHIGWGGEHIVPL